MSKISEMMLELKTLAAENPELARKVFEAKPEAVRILNELQRRYEAGKQVSVDGFKIFYDAIYSRPLPDVDIPIVEAFVNAFKNKTGVIEECWRGFGKSTLLIAWAAYVMGARPVGSTALVRINETKAKEAGDTIAELVEKNPGWKKIFPHVIPDKDAGWSVERGYHVKDVRVCGENDEKYDEWARLCFADHVSEPSLATGGVSSGIIIGMHPTNGMWMDDLHDEDNTRSAAEMKKVVDILDGNIIPTWFSVTGSPALGVACTPWSEKDAYARMMKTGIFTKVTMPIFVKRDAWEAGLYDDHPARSLWEHNLRTYSYKRFEPYGCDVILTWPEAFDIKRVVAMYDAGPARFGQMYLLDLETLKGLTLKREWLGEFPYDKIMGSWPTYFGIDFASTTDKLGIGDTDYFACAIGKAPPTGGVILTGGFRALMSQAEAIAKVQALNSIYNPVAIGVEKYGSGRTFIENIVSTTLLPIIPMPPKGAPVRSKGQRYEMGLAPDFQNGRMWVSSLEDDFIKTFKEEWVSWDGGLARSRTGHDDTLDGVYWLREIALGNIIKMRSAGAEQEEQEQQASAFATAASFYRRD